MRIIFVGDSPTVNTGFSRCTRAACDELHSAGHDVIVLGMGYYGDPHSFPYPIYPCVQPYESVSSYGGEQRLPLLIDRFKPDLVIILQDPWNIPQYFKQLDEAKEHCDKKGLEFSIPPIIGWIAVDSENQKSDQLERLSHIVVWTDFAKDELFGRDSTIPRTLNYSKISVVPLGVDTDLFRPYDKLACRKELLEDSIPLDSFLIGVVGRNQPRKNIHLSIEYFAAWVQTYNIDNAYLFLHVAPTGERGCDIKSLIRYYSLKGRVIISEPPIGVGNDDSLMPKIYSMFDLLMTQSQAEGWYLPGLEALACGVPCLVPDFAALGSRGWAQDTVFRVECSHASLTAPLNGNPYTIGRIPDKTSTVDWLQFLYYHRNGKLKSNVQKGLDLAQKLTWKNCGRMFREEVERVYRETSTTEKVDNFFDQISGMSECSMCGEFFNEDEIETHKCGGYV